MNFDDALESEFYEKEARKMYEERVQECLLEGKWFTLVDCLDDTIDMVHYGRKMWNAEVYNTYIPVKHTIMKKPNLHDNFNDDLAF
jgi:hypothetical protein